jgi:hypothetical protein
MFGFIFPINTKALIWCLIFASSHKCNWRGLVWQCEKPRVSIKCFYILQHPNLPLCHANTSWNWFNIYNNYSVFFPSRFGSILIFDLIFSHLPLFSSKVPNHHIKIDVFGFFFMFALFYWLHIFLSYELLAKCLWCKWISSKCFTSNQVQKPHVVQVWSSIEI